MCVSSPAASPHLMHKMPYKVESKLRRGAMHRFSNMRGEGLAASFTFHLFATLQADSLRVITFSNEEDIIYFRHHMFEKKGSKEVVLHEVGPRFEMQLYQLRLGTLDQVRKRKVQSRCRVFATSMSQITFGQSILPLLHQGTWYYCRFRRRFHGWRLPC